MIVVFASAAVVMIGVSVPAIGADAGHRMVGANDLKWADIPSLPPGAKIAVIEGPLNEAVPFTFRLRFPAN
jgi:hypothetical protein